MTKLYLYTAFHANLKFSSIPEEQYSLVLDRCYWPALDLLEGNEIITTRSHIVGSAHDPASPKRVYFTRK